MTSHFLLKGHKMLNFLFAFFLEMSETLEAHMSGMETDIKNGEKLSFQFSTVFHISQ